MTLLFQCNAWPALSHRSSGLTESRRVAQPGEKYGVGLEIKPPPRARNTVGRVGSMPTGRCKFQQALEDRRDGPALFLVRVE